MLLHRKQLQWLQPEWAAPRHVNAYVSTRHGCLSQAPYDGFNTADHVGDVAYNVNDCRRVVRQSFRLLEPPRWLQQVHGTTVAGDQEFFADNHPQADAHYTAQTNSACMLHTADCLPVFFCNQSGTEIALAHAGWRGLAAGILQRTLARFSDAPDAIMCWLGPCISQPFFEVGPDVKAAFANGFVSDSILEEAFTPSGRVSEQGIHYYCDLPLLARGHLAQQGVAAITGGDLCTYSDSRFYSYRQTPKTGRILSMIWLSDA